MHTFTLFRLLLLMVLLGVQPSVISSANAQSTPGKQECKAIKQKIRDIHSKMRAGYTRAQGERLEERLRKLRAKRAKQCR